MDAAAAETPPPENAKPWEAVEDGEYAIVELFGHTTLVGRVAEVERFGAKMLALEPIFAGTAERVTSAGFGHGAEWGLMGFSIIVAFGGFFAARVLYKDGRSPIPARLLASPSPLVQATHRTIFNKYYVDELYGVVFVKGSLVLSRGLAIWDTRVIDGAVNLAGTIGRGFGFLQGAIDRLFVDGMVELVAKVVEAAGAKIRRIQTGHIQAYVQGLALGALALVALAYLLAW